MKFKFKKTNKYVLLSILYTLQCGMASAQATWGVVGTKYHYANSWDDWFGIYEGVTTVGITRDTLLQGKECRVFEQTAISNVYWNGWVTPSEGAPVIFFEEEGRVYYHNHDVDTFALLYDFNKAAGESWTVPVWNGWAELCPPLTRLSVYVDSVSVEEVNGQPLGVQHVTISSPPDEWQYHLSDKIYEGIGSGRRMFFIELSCVTVFSTITGLSCVDHPDAGQLNFTDEPCPTTSTDDGTPANPWQVSLHPNPVTQRATVSCEGAFDVSVSDFSGRVLFQGTRARDTLEVDMSAYPAGVYVVRVTQGQRAITKKIVKQ